MTHAEPQTLRDGRYAVVGVLGEGVGFVPTHLFERLPAEQPHRPRNDIDRGDEPLGPPGEV